MRIGVVSDFHVMAAAEKGHVLESHKALGAGLPALQRKWRRGLYRMRRLLWNTHPELREIAFERALNLMETFKPDWVIANGDYGGDHSGMGVSDDATFESAAHVVGSIRRRFPENSRFVFGDHDIGKYSTERREGGIRIASLHRGEKQLGIPSFWHEIDEDVHLIGVNSSLCTLDLFLPEALVDEVPEWKRCRAEHIEHVSHAFDGLPAKARVVLFCHDPSALHALSQVPIVKRRMKQIELTVIGHLHSPSLLKLAKLMPASKGWRPKYPVARIIAHGLEGVKSWHQFNPVVCPSTFGTGHHFRGGLLFIEKDKHGKLVARRRRVSKK